MAYDDLLKRIGSRIRQRRKELGITQEELAGSEYTKSFISQVEKGQTWPSLPALAYIAQRLGRPIEWFVAEEIPNPSALHEIAREVGLEPEQVLLVLAAVLRKL